MLVRSTAYQIEDPRRQAAHALGLGGASCLHGCRLCRSLLHRCKKSRDGQSLPSSYPVLQHRRDSPAPCPGPQRPSGHGLITPEERATRTDHPTFLLNCVLRICHTIRTGSSLSHLPHLAPRSLNLSESRRTPKMKGLLLGAVGAGLPALIFSKASEHCVSRACLAG